MHTYSLILTVASTPESLPTKREEPSAGSGAAGAGGSSSSVGSGGSSGIGAAASGGGGGAGGAGAASTAEPNNGEQSPTICELSSSSSGGANATINGQVASK